MSRPGQAMLETVIAVLIVTSVFLCLFKLSQLLTRKILLEHAAMRVARARTVGMNDFMCQKAARVAIIPIAGARTWPVGAIGAAAERARIGIYMLTDNPAKANGVLEYADWHELTVEAGDGTSSRVEFKGLEGRAGIEPNHPLYLFDSGL